jgi:putative transposase
MSLPRPVVENRIYMVTRRCAGRRFYLRPCKEVEQAFLFCLAVAARRYGIDVYWLCVLSNHYHLGVRDVHGNYPEFLQFLNSLVARCLNALLGRWENFWCSEQSGVLHLSDGEAVMDKMVYSLANPVKAQLVEKVGHWPGVNSLRHQLNGRPLVVKRPYWFFDKNGGMPDELELHFARPAEFAELSQEEWAEKIRTAVTLEEKKAAEVRSQTDGHVVGRKAILRQSPFSCPRTATERRGLRPRVATRNKWRRIELLKANKSFLSSYRRAYERRLAGSVDVEFPYGTYQLRKLQAVCCQQGPPLQ